MILSESVDRSVAEWEEKQRSSMARMLARRLHERFGGLAEGVRTRLHSASRDWGARVEVGCGWTKGGRGEQRATLVQASDITEPTLPPTLTDPFAGTFIATKVPKRARVAADRKFKRCTARHLVRQGLSGETIGKAKEAD
jgi:hypothetical protein